MATILVVDDDPSIRTLLSFALADVGEVITAAEAWTACDLVRRRHPDIALVDVMMPGRTGLELVRAWRRDDTIRRFPIVVMTARDLRDDEMTAYEAGADAYLPKPFDIDVVTDLVWAHVPLPAAVRPARRLATAAVRPTGFTRTINLP